MMVYDAPILTPGNIPEGDDFKRYYTDALFAQDVIDFGCGYGRLAELFSKRRYRGLDTSPGVIETARRANHGYQFDVDDGASPIEGGHALFAHDVLIYIGDAELPMTVARFRQKRIIVSECIGASVKRNGVTAREIEQYDRVFGAAGYRLHRVQFRNWPRGAEETAIMEFHKL